MNRTESMLTSTARLDLRLVPAAAGVWLVGLAATADSRSLVVWCAVAAAIVLAAGVLRLRLERADELRRAAGAGLVLAGIAVLAASLVAVLRQSERLDSPLLAAADSGSFVTVRGVVAGDPIPLRAGAAGARVLVPLSVQSLSFRGRTFSLDRSAVVLGAAQGWAGVLPGQQVVVKGRAVPPLANSTEDAAISERGPPDLIGGPPYLQRIAGAVRTSLSDSAHRTLPADAAGLLVALVDGDTARVDPVVEADFRQLGLSHLLAVSGANCAIISGAVLWLTRRLRLPFALQVALTALALVAFVIIARPSPSVLRAAAMGAVTLVAMASGRVRSAVPALAGSVLVLLVVSPALATSAGFALSVAATAGIVVLGPPWTERLRRWMPFPFAAALAVAGAAGVATAPLLILLNPVVNLASIPANIAAAPAVPFATVLGVMAAIVGPWWPWTADLLVWCAGLPVRWLILVAHQGTLLPESQFSWPAGLVGALCLGCALAGAAVLVRLTRTRTRVRAVIAGIVVGTLVLAVPIRVAVRGWPPAGWLIVACDVGQGDALVIRAGPQAAIIVDVGPEPVLLDRCLRELGVTEVPMLILSHLHQDHIGGLDAVLGRRMVGEIDISPLHDPPEAFSRVSRAAAAAGVPVRTPLLDEQRVVGDAVVTVIGPLATRRNTRSDLNNNSLLVRVDIRGVSILLAGDAEIEEQSEYADQAAALDVDILKVPHHGSAYQTEKFLAATSAQVALISVGAGNSYGHPSPLTMAELGKLGMTAYRTDQSGDIAIIDVEGTLSVLTHPTVT